MVQLLWKSACHLLKQVDTDLPYDPAISLLGIQPKELKTERATTFITALFAMPSTVKSLSQKK